jgi:hypothetical protein
VARTEPHGLCQIKLAAGMCCQPRAGMQLQSVHLICRCATTCNDARRCKDRHPRTHAEITKERINPGVMYTAGCTRELGLKVDRLSSVFRVVAVTSGQGVVSRKSSSSSRCAGGGVPAS